MKRRDFICLIGATALSIPRTGYAQTKTDLPLVAFLLLPKPETTLAKERISALRKGLQEEGFVEGTNYSLAVRSAEGDFNRLPQLVKKLGTPRHPGFGAAPAQRSSPEIPLVFASIAADPIASCVVAAGAFVCYAVPPAWWGPF
jgi:putative tryptophan/tyrosine transport system substrate-binding protein